MAEGLCKELDVKGNLHLTYLEKAGAASSRVAKGENLIIVGDKELRLEDEEIYAVLAHEVAHLQRGHSYHPSHFFKASALPVALAAAILSGVGTIPAGALAAAVWGTLHLTGKAVARSEERRADKVATEVAGPVFLTALARISPGYEVDGPWRSEDLFNTHGSLRNRSADSLKVPGNSPEVEKIMAIDPIDLPPVNLGRSRVSKDRDLGQDH
jgi:hypothetical protein